MLLDSELLELCDELESLGGGINTRIEPIRAQSSSSDELISVSKSIRPHFNTTFIIDNINVVSQIVEQIEYE